MIAFLEPKGLVPKVAHCENLACTDATISSIDPQGDTFRDGISVAIGSDGLPLISYETFGLKVAHCSDVACTSATTATLDSGDRGDWSSIAIGSDGLGLISYFDRDTGSLKVGALLERPLLVRDDRDARHRRHRRVHVADDRLRRPRA